MLLEGDLDASFVSTAHFLSHRDKLMRIPSLVIAGTHSVMSVLLLSESPPATLHEQALALSAESASSVRFLQILCKDYWKIAPRFSLLTADTAPSTARLLIGDSCLEERQGWPHQVDIAREWRKMTGLPAVFGLLCARHDLHGDQCAEIEQTLCEALEWSAIHHQELIEYSSKASGISASELRKYFSVLDYKLRPHHERSIALFEERSENLTKPLIHA